MSIKINLKIKPSATVTMNTFATQKKAAGERVYNLSAGEPMVKTHPTVIAAANAAMQEGKTLYAPVAGIPELRKAASEWMNENYDTRYTQNETLVTCGGKFGIFALCQALLTPGDEVLILSPYWVSYPDIVEIFKGVPRIVKSRLEDWKITIDDLEKSFTSKSKVLIINNGGNPTGVLYSRSELKEICDWAAKKDLTIIADEVYSGLAYDNAEFVSVGSFAEHKERTAIIQSCSKHFAMTGWRVGFVFAPEVVIKTLTALQSQSTTGTSSISQWAALAAFENASEIILTVREAMRKRRNVFVETFEKLFGNKINVPSAGLYAFVSLKSLGVKEVDSVKFCTRALEEGNVAMVPGAPFGQEGFARFSFGAEEAELKAALMALKKFVG